jgi:phosphoketolase
VRLREHVPGLKIRVVDVVDLMTLQLKAIQEIQFTATSFPPPKPWPT